MSEVSKILTALEQGDSFAAERLPALIRFHFCMAITRTGLDTPEH